MCLLINERYKTFLTGFLFLGLGRGTRGLRGQKFFFPKFNQIWYVSYSHERHVQWHFLILSSLGIDHRRRKTIPLWNSPGENRVLQGITLYVWYLQYGALCDDLVDFKLRAGVRYLSFSIDTAPECIL